MTIKTREIAIPKTITKLGGEMPNRPNKESFLNTLGYCSAGNTKNPATLGPIISPALKDEIKSDMPIATFVSSQRSTKIDFDTATKPINEP